MNTYYKHITLTALSSLLLILLSLSLSSQPRQLSTENRRAIRFYEEAKEQYDRYNVFDAIEALDRAVAIDNNFIEAYLFLSQIHQRANQPELAIVAGENAVRINPDFFPSIHFNIGSLLFRKGEYDRALAYFRTFLTYDNIRAEARKLAELRLESCEFAIHSIANPVPFTPINLGPNVNTNMDEYWPSLSADENTLVITVNIPRDPSSPEVMYNRQEDFFITTRGDDGEWQPVRNLGPPINTPHFNEGAQSLTADGNRMYYTICRGNCNLFFSDKDERGNWQRPRPLPSPLNLVHTSEKQPSISPDGRTLYFVSNRSGGFGDFDIWKAHRIDEHTWSEPKNLGDSINTPFIEQSPFIHFDNQTLYFSSNGHVGMGGLDIYVTRKLNDSTWSTPKNLGYPINTSRDEDGLIVNARGNMAYFSSDINPESGRDIYKFELPEEIRPTPTSYIRGTITDAMSGWPIDADISLVDVTTNEEQLRKDDVKSGQFLITLPTNRNYAFFASTPGYLFYSRNFNLEGVYSKVEPYHLDIELSPIRVGGTLIMRNVFFETDKYELQDESIAELDRLIELLTVNPSMRIEVGGHTDSVGPAEYNLTLSDKRAESVASYIINKGISSDRITWKGYGLTKPIGDNATEEGRAENRRTEIRVVGI